MCKKKCIYALKYPFSLDVFHKQAKTVITVRINLYKQHIHLILNNQSMLKLNTYLKKKNVSFSFKRWFRLVWFLYLMAYQLLAGYLMPKPFS